jgi:putative ABC transport system permease protein
MSDFNYAFRQLIKNPGFSAGVILILAIAIGANTAEFSLTNAVLLKPLPWPKADRFAYVWNTAPQLGWPRGPISIPEYLDRKNQTDAFEDAALFTGGAFNLSSGASPVLVVGLRVTPSFFSTVGAYPSKGRAFIPDEAVVGRDKVAIISYNLWQDQFGGREDTLGGDIRLNRENYRIVGIMPKKFVSPAAGLSAFGGLNPQVWMPYAFTPEQQADKERGNWTSIMLARLRPGATLAQAQEEVDAVEQHYDERMKYAGPSRKEGGFGGLVVDYREQNTQSARPMLLILQTAVALILLIACANIANLMLVRATARKKELAIRLALGAGRFRLARQLLAENFALVFLGGALGVLFGDWGLGLLSWLRHDLFASDQAIMIDRTVLAFALTVCLGSGLFFGLVPLLAIWRQDPGDALRDGSGRGSAGRSTGLTRASLIVAEVALALMLLIAAGLTLKSFANLQRVRTGFASDQVLTAGVSLPTNVYKDIGTQSAFFAEALTRIRALPGVSSASAITLVPFGHGVSTTNYSIKGYVPKAGEPSFNTQIRPIDPDYFQTMKIRLRQGRFFSATDTAKSAPVVIVDQFLVHRRFGDRNPIGQQIKTSYTTGQSDWCTIVGVVDEVRTGDLAEPVAKETVYFPLAQQPSLIMTLVVKTEGDPLALVAPLRKTIQSIDPELPAYEIHTMNELMADSLENRRMPMTLLLVFGGTALILAAFGLYAVLAYSVGQRTREIGIRIALGAQGRAILGLIVRQGLRLTLLGLVLGIAASFGLTRLLRSLLFGVSANDPLIYAAVAALLVVVAVFACYVPARRATKINPLVALRSE